MTHAWHPDGPTAIIRDDGRYRIARSPQEGYGPPDAPVTLVLVDSTEHRIINGKRGLAERDVRKATDWLKEKAHA